MTPKGLYRFVEDSQDRELEDNANDEGEIKKPSVTEMCSLDMWLHKDPSILNQGKVKHNEPKPGPGEEDIEPEELMKREIAKDPWEKRLKPISDDQKTKGGMPAWILRSYETQSNLIDEKTGKASKNYGTVVVRSLWWPGSFSFYNSGRLLQVYCGDGLKHVQPSVSYYPVLPPIMIDERDEKKCYDEPNPTEEWLKKRAAAEASGEIKKAE